jgi:pimeloyl-ACP methyl ester carboxylesterase
MAESRTFVLQHGAWHGGWCWSRVADILRAQGHRVFTPTQTGLGERAHLMSRDITLDTFVQDLANVVEAEELSDIVLVGHSFGGLAISGVADRMPGRIRHLVYLDSRIVGDGETVFGTTVPAIAAERRRLAEEASGGVWIPNPSPESFGVPPGPDADWVRRRLTPHPLGTMISPMHLKHPVGNGLPRTYIVCTDPVYDALESVRQWVKQQAGWGWREIATGHDAMVTAPGPLADMLVELAA